LNAKTISVAGFKILIQSEKVTGLGLEQGYIPFIINNENRTPDIEITAVNGIPPSLLTSNKLLFEANDHLQKYFSVYENKDSYKFIIYSPVIKNKIQQIALLNLDFTKWIIYSDVSEEKEEVFPLLYPLGPLIFYYLTVKYNTVMIHASGVFESNYGRIFAGFSGSGKSTMAWLWQKSGGKIVNDDRIVICREDQGYFMYNTPMFYTDIPKKTPLHSIYILGHSKENHLKRLEGVKAVSGVLAFCIQHGFNSLFIEHHIDFLSELCLKIPIYNLEFAPDERAIDFIKKYGV
jgi:hypothetical protein